MLEILIQTQEIELVPALGGHSAEGDIGLQANLPKEMEKSQF